MENNNILKTERKIIKRLPNPNKYPTKNRERHTRKLGRYIANYASSENANIKNRVTRFNALRRQIANLPPYEATENAGTLNEGAPLSVDCAELFDPCTREPIPDLKTLEKRIRELKKQKEAVPFGLYGLTNSTSNYDFLTTVFVNPEISIDDMVSFKLSEGRAKPGTDIFEVLSRLFVFFGGIDGVNPRNGGNYKFRNKLEGGGTEYPDAKTALKRMKCIASSGSGVSDITLTNVVSGKKQVRDDAPYCEVPCDLESETESIKTYLMSVKWYTQEKNAEHYDLEKLYVAAEKATTEEQRQSYSIIVFLKSKHDFEIAHRRASRQLTRYLAKTFFGYYEDVRPFLEDIRQNIFEFAKRKKITTKDAVEELYFSGSSKVPLRLQLHQDIITKGLCDVIDTNRDNRYLIGVLPRGGKTFIAGGIIREYLQRKNMPKLNILWLTAAPTETKSQVQNELIDLFLDFEDFEFVDCKQHVIEGKKKHYVYFSSTQLLVTSEKERPYLQKILSGEDKLGLVFFDEAHKTGAGDETKAEIQSIFDRYYQDNLPFIFLTATYYNILFNYGIKPENTFIWDYTDVLATRALATETEQQEALTNLRARFGQPLVDYIIEKRKANGESLETMAKAYIGFPDLYFVSADFQDEAIARFAEQSVYTPDAGFSLQSIFAIQPLTKPAMLNMIKTRDQKIRKDAFKLFYNLTNPRNIINLITPSGTFTTLIADSAANPLVKIAGSPEQSDILSRINVMSRDAESRFRIDEQPTILMFMPTGGAGTNIYGLLCAWATLLMDHSWWKENYEVACVVSGEDMSEKELQDIEKAKGVVKPGVLSLAADNVHVISKNPKSTIQRLERALHCTKGKRKGLVILAGEKLSMGISLPCTDIVFLFNQKKSPDDIIQKMYRALTPSEGKKASFVVDLNPVRTLAALYGYTKASHKNLHTKTEIMDIIYSTYTWDADVFDYNLTKGADARPIKFQNRLGELYDKAEVDPEYKLKDDIGGFEKKMAENIKKGITKEFVVFLSGTFDDKKAKDVTRRFGLKDDSTVKIDSTGKLVVRRLKTPEELAAVPTNIEPDKVEIVIENFVETVEDFVKYLALTSTKSTLDGALDEYQTSIDNMTGVGERGLRQNVYNLLKSRRHIEGDSSILPKLMVGAVKEFAYHSSESVFSQMKSKIDERSIRKDKILSIINERLKTRKVQRRGFGEVFTPTTLIEKIMTHLPKSVWKNPNLKWLDPANGIGNFPVVVFYKLDEGLKEWEPNEDKRRKHIIENMLFMIELQSNNNRIARNIFKSLCDGCKPNILTADSTNLTSAKLKANGFPDKYDIVMGNPPFQKGRNMMFYVYFIDLANKLIKDDGYLLYIIPNKILIPNKANESIKQFNPLYIYHTVNKDFLPTVISTTICAVICKKEPFDNETKVQFDNGEININLEMPTPTQYNDIKLKEISDKILVGRGRQYLVTSKEKPTKPHIYISRVWIRYSPDKPSGGDHIFNISDAPRAGDDGSGKYITIPENITKSTLIWFLSRSEAMRLITKVYAGAMNVPAFLWNFIPFIPLKTETNAEVNQLLGLNATDEKAIKEYLNDNVQANLEEGNDMEGGTRTKTRKLRRH
jgi:hypothetical protein